MEQPESISNRVCNPAATDVVAQTWSQSPKFTAKSQNLLAKRESGQCDNLLVLLAERELNAVGKFSRCDHRNKNPDRKKVRIKMHLGTTMDKKWSKYVSVSPNKLTGRRMLYAGRP